MRGCMSTCLQLWFLLVVHDKIALTMRYTLVVLVLIFVFHIWSLYCYFTYVIVICFAKPPHIAKDEISLKFRFVPGAFKTTPRYFQDVLRLLITSLWYLLAIVLSVLRFTASDYLPLVSFGHCIVCPSIYGLWLPPFGIFKLFLYIFWKLRMFCFSF
jgi:hypothetical protein